VKNLASQKSLEFDSDWEKLEKNSANPWQVQKLKKWAKWHNLGLI